MGTVTACSALLAGTLSTLAMAAEPAAEGGASGAANVSTSAGGNASGATNAGGAAPADGAAEPAATTAPEPAASGRRSDQEWIKRWAPERNMAEVGVFGGAFLPSRRLELFDPDPTLGPLQGFKEFNRVAPSIGLRLGFYPSRYFGLEGEAGVMPTRTADNLAATLWGMRFSLVGQLGQWSVTPFVLAGAGMLNVGSDRAAVGSDIDAAVHLGGGIKFHLTRYTMLRIDVRDHITAGQGVDSGVVHNPEALLGFAVTLGRKKIEAPPAPVDTDGDGIFDPDDECVDVPGVPEYNGCPIPDTDGDGVLDPDDECPDVAGLEEFAGCPDTDEDGIRDPDDACPEEPGVPEYDGCPIPDTDCDEILDPQDACPLQPENRNGYKDDDGCCDLIPNDIKRFTGVIRGIYFATNKATIKRKSERVLREALRVFREYPDFNVEIIGHTDSRGSREHNLNLSEARAESVRRWLVDRDIAPTRIITRGAGPDEPLEPNNTKRGRAKNRRIEFKLQNLPAGPPEDEGICQRPLVDPNNPPVCRVNPSGASPEAGGASATGPDGANTTGADTIGPGRSAGKGAAEGPTSSGSSTRKPPVRPKTPAVAPK